MILAYTLSMPGVGSWNGQGKYPLDVCNQKRHNPLTNRRRLKNMSVCLAALCNWKGYKDEPGGPVIVGVCDRMVTHGDVEYEPKQPFVNKAWQFGGSMVIMAAGDIGTSLEAYKRTILPHREKLNTDNTYCPKVGEVAETYADHYRKLRTKYLETMYLSRHGMDMVGFLASMRALDPVLLSAINTRIDNDHDVDIDAIIAGIDSDGTQIYIVDSNGWVVNKTSIGWAAIGIGEYHAQSEFLAAQHAPSEDMETAILTAYGAKKRAEIAQGVGKIETDMFLVGPRDGVIPLNAWVPTLGKIYKETIQAAQARGQKLGERKVRDFVNSFLEKASQQSKGEDQQISTANEVIE